MPRSPYADPNALSEDTRAILDRLPVKLNVFRMMANAESSFRGFLTFGRSILAQQQLSAKLRELAILRVGSLSRCRYEWIQHVPIALATGCTQEQIDALERSDLGAACFDDAERAVLHFTTDVLQNVRASDETLAPIQARFSPREVVELLLTVGNYMMIARVLETTGVEIDAPAAATVGGAVKPYRERAV